MLIIRIVVCLTSIKTTFPIYEEKCFRSSPATSKAAHKNQHSAQSTLQPYTAPSLYIAAKIGHGTPSNVWEPLKSSGPRHLKLCRHLNGLDPYNAHSCRNEHYWKCWRKIGASGLSSDVKVVWVPTLPCLIYMSENPCTVVSNVLIFFSKSSPIRRQREHLAQSRVLKNLRYRRELPGTFIGPRTVLDHTIFHLACWWLQGGWLENNRSPTD